MLCMSDIRKVFLGSLGNGPRPYACEGFWTQRVFFAKSISENFSTFQKTHEKGSKFTCSFKSFFAFDPQKVKSQTI